MSTLDELLALLPDNTTGAIDAEDLREVVTGLFNNSETNAANIDSHESQIEGLAGRVELLESRSDSVAVSFPWQYSNSALPPTGNQVRMNDADPALATEVVFWLTDTNGQDHTALFSGGTFFAIRIQHFDDSTVFAQYDVTGPVVVTANDATIPVTFIHGGSETMTSQKVLALFLLDVASV